MAVGKVGDLLRQQAGRTEPLAIDDEAAERPPLFMRRGIEGVVFAPCGPRLVEDTRQILDAVPISRSISSGSEANFCTTRSATSFGSSIQVSNDPGGSIPA
jgi:hypothetical protein